MTQRPAGRSAVVTTGSLAEYAWAAVNGPQLARRLGLARTFPPLLGDRGAGDLAALARYYDVEFLPLRTLIPHPLTTAAAGILSGPADPASLALRVLRGFAGQGPAGSHEERPLPPCRASHVVVARATSPFAVPAAVYAALTGKRLVLDDEVVQAAREIVLGGAATVMLVDEPDSFTKRALRDILAWGQERDERFGGVGILTASGTEQLTAVVWRLLAHRTFAATGGRSALPDPGAEVAVRNMAPLEYYVLAGHGNETHVEHGEEVLHATPPDREHEAWPCGDEAHVPARSFPAHHVIVLSCDLFTPTDGLAPGSSTLFYDLLAGWPAAIVAPYKHAQINNGLRVLADSLVRSGYTLGEITERLNGIARFGSEGDPAYGLLGDPELVLFPESRWETDEAPASVDRSADGIAVECAPRGERAIEWWVGTGDLPPLMQRCRSLAVDPGCDVLADREMLFAFLPRPRIGRLGVLLFSPRALPRAPHRFSLKPADALPEADVARLAERGRRLLALGALGIGVAIVDEARTCLLTAQRIAGAYPRAIEFTLAERAARHALPLLGPDLARIRRAVLDDLRRGIATERSWLSHQYRRACAPVGRADPDPGYERCPTCGQDTTHWRCEDPAAELEPRRLVICHRCGIIADRPFEAVLDVRFSPSPLTGGQQYSERFCVTNCSAEPLEASVAAQFNEWEMSGIAAHPTLHELALDAGASETVTVEFSFATPPKPDAVSLHCYAMSERCELSAFTRKVVYPARLRPTAPATSPGRVADFAGALGEIP